MEKLTINLPPVEVARIDILVEAGYYPSRAEFIRSSIRNTLDMHRDYIEKRMDTLTSRSRETLSSAEGDVEIFGIGVHVLGKEELERAIAQGRKVKLHVIGMLKLGKSVTPELIESAVTSAKVYGVLRASPQVKRALQGKMERT
jgi:Arc/MetJ-type ribon-helix-helix transcriptional regulator